MLRKKGGNIEDNQRPANANANVKTNAPIIEALPIIANSTATNTANSIASANTNMNTDMNTDMNMNRSVPANAPAPANKPAKKILCIRLL
ncbi:MAG: hypothetical protein GY795_41085 [Desulfobacterales bacterium]|nr:hypothetical protein [Desulfobacterales bacterium]